MPKAVARQQVNWCNRSIEWIAVDGEIPRNAMWSYQLDGLTYYSFPFDPEEPGPTTRERALNWLNRHHLIIRREHLVADLAIPMR
ncbi:MAG: hypothetical protein AB7L66_11780 [Gemmatimonadales bacterium]